jgi:SH3-like domain-containing protein
VNVEGWLKVRDLGGTVAWIEKKSVSERRMLVVRNPTADILAQPEASAPVLFKAEQNVLLELVDPSYATATPGWAKVRHRDGQTGFVRIQQVWGL